MGLLNSSLQIGRSALLSYQDALQVVGSNISSAGSPDYTRLLPQLDPLQGAFLGRDLQPGAGVALTDIQRNIDEALEGRLRLAMGAAESAAVQQRTLAELELLFADASGSGLATQLATFLGGFDELQNSPESATVRDLAINNGVRLGETIRTMRAQLLRIIGDVDGQIADTVAAVDDMARRVAGLNTEITRAEAGRRAQATGLRDQRDALLRGLSEMVDVTVREQPDGALNVYIGSEALVQGSHVRGLVSVAESDGQVTRTSARFADSNQQVNVRGGQLGGLIMSRDRYGHDQIAALDRLAEALIAEVNQIHADGQGLVGLETVTGTNEVLATDARLDSDAAGLVFPPRNGSFFITVTDDVTGTPVAYRIDVNLDNVNEPTTLESLVADINEQVDGVTASITSDKRLTLSADEGIRFTFGHDGQEARKDTSGVLAALGINTLFSGSSARDIEVNAMLLEQPSLISAASVFLPGDGTNAGRIAALDTTKSDRLGASTLPGFYTAIVGSVAITAAAGNDAMEATSTVLSSLVSQKESISGVNLDEEAISLIKYERAFQGASRYIGVVDQLLSELVMLIR